MHQCPAQSRRSPLGPTRPNGAFSASGSRPAPKKTPGTRFPKALLLGLRPAAKAVPVIPSQAPTRGWGRRVGLSVRPGTRIGIEK